MIWAMGNKDRRSREAKKPKQKKPTVNVSQPPRRIVVPTPTPTVKEPGS
jgi:hypothetical protein